MGVLWEVESNKRVLTVYEILQNQVYFYIFCKVYHYQVRYILLPTFTFIQARPTFHQCHNQWWNASK